ncbi:hypothetical protein [Bythopirellula goksoeyrii]|uniref:Uncharacterized protein n=1 Tax=Bythopirellula goksoeyrii TaxID=1400387 RepID=A0A5B9QUH0_9BACT|nr:hypothetical protein [Bythopirellula goksoeyrii]QEG37711.1 hypothetical protein Pr1d_50570 [Bythopirellula goksoeyrii]
MTNSHEAISSSADAADQQPSKVIVLGGAATARKTTSATWPSPSPMPFVKHDGGRSDAGYRGKAGDYVIRAIAIAAGLSYLLVYAELRRRNEHFRRTSRCRAARRMKSSTPRNGTNKRVYDPYLLDLGFTWTPTMGIGTGCRFHLHPDELPTGRLVVRLSGHLAAVIDGTLYDTKDCSRGGTRCVYGFYQRS